MNRELADEAESVFQKGRMAVEYADVDTLKEIMPGLRDMVNKLK